MPVTKDCEDCDSRKRDDAQAAALSALGIPVKTPARSVVEARLLLEDLDGDGVAEALFTVELDMSDIHLVVLKRKGNQWYRLPSSPDLSCWCRYENSPLDTFVELRNWSYSSERPPQPIRLIFLHASGGGTGLYERDVKVFALHGFELRSVFSSTEELRAVTWPEGDSELEHVVITVEEGNRGPRALVTDEIRSNGGGPDESWWAGLPIAACKAYTWSMERFKFVPNTAATSMYCPAQQLAPKSAKPQH